MKKFGIIGAMELEVEALKAKLTDANVTVRAQMEFWSGRLGGAEVVVVRCGIGKVNAALCVQILADLYGVTHVMNTGVAGSLNAELDIGDILVSRDVVHHDVDVRIFGYQLGEVPQLGIREFPADPQMAELAVTLCGQVNPEVHVRLGRVVSGDQFISDSQVKARLIENFQGDCAEMEGASIAHGAWLNGLPFVVIRAISDKADDSAEMDYPTFEHAAAQHSARLVEALVTALAREAE